MFAFKGPLEPLTDSARPARLLPSFVNQDISCCHRMDADAGKRFLASAGVHERAEIKAQAGLMVSSRSL